ncbi:hypothetical protein EDEG_04206, partial [Edhazardia aedis USNM 41457]
MNISICIVGVLQSAINGIFCKNYGNKNLSMCLPGVLYCLMRIPTTFLFKKDKTLPKTTKKFVFHVFIVSAMTEIQNLLIWIFAPRVTAIIFALCFQTNIIIFYLILITITKQYLKKFQYLCYGTTLLGITVVGLDFFKSDAKIEYYACFSVFIAAIMNIIACLYYENLIKKSMENLFQYMFINSCFGLFINIIMSFCEFYIRKKLEFKKCITEKYLYLGSFTYFLGTILGFVC